MTATLLDTSPEIRLIIYDILLNTISERDAVAISHLQTWSTTSSTSSTNTATSYNWIFTHPLIFTEAADIIAKTHPITIQKLSHLSTHRSILLLATTIILDLGPKPPKNLHSAMRLLQHLPNLRSLTIIAKARKFWSYYMPKPHEGFRQLQHLNLIDRELAAEEAIRKPYDEARRDAENLRRAAEEELQTMNRELYPVWENMDLAWQANMVGDLESVLGNMEPRLSHALARYFEAITVTYPVMSHYWRQRSVALITKQYDTDYDVRQRRVSDSS